MPSANLRPPDLPAAVSAGSGAIPPPPVPPETAAAGRRQSWLWLAAKHVSTAGWVLSLLLHLLGYVTAAAFFLFLRAEFLPTEFEHVAPLRASLDDQTLLEDESPRFEILPEMNSGTDDTESPAQQLASHLQIVETGLVDTVSTEALLSLNGDQDDDGSGDEGSGFFFQLPESGLAVTKGSFSAWTEPEHPAPGENYLIIIEIRLPPDVRQYRVSDLRGSSVRGSDDYQQSIPYDRRMVSTIVSDEGRQRIENEGQRVTVSAGKVQLTIKVPGAQRLVKDTINIRSRRLREQQELELVFGRRPDSAK